MKKCALIEKYPSDINYSVLLNFDFDKFSLVNTKMSKVLVKDIELDLNNIRENYDYIILVGAEPCKLVGKVGSVTEYQGFLVEEQYIPMLNPSAVKMRPSLEHDFSKSIENINTIVLGRDFSKTIDDFDIIGIETEEEAIKHIDFLLSKLREGSISHVAWDTETSALYVRDGYVLGLSLSYKKEQGVYISSECIDSEVENKLKILANSCIAVFHNYKFDKKFIEYNFNITFPLWEDTMLLHYSLDEKEGTHGLKSLALKYTELGDYSKPLDTYKREYCKKHRILLKDFTYDLIPFDIMYPYAALDTGATIELFEIFYPKISCNVKLLNVYNRLLKQGTEFLSQIEENGIPINIEKAADYIKDIDEEIHDQTNILYSFEEVKIYEHSKGSPFNVNSPTQKAEMFFNILGLPSSKRTKTGNASTDAEVIDELAKLHKLPKVVQGIMKLKKIKSTYLQKFINGIDMDGRLRTNFNLHITSSGRLSSSGKINAQQLPRDDKRPKNCIEAREGFKIVNQDLKTAEMYVAAVLSGDKALQQIFIEGVDYHGAMAVNKFNLPCTPDQVKELYPDLRQDAKTISFEILYKLNYKEEALQGFPQLKKWLQAREQEIKDKGYLYSHFGRKRRLEDVNSPNRQESQHIIRSGINSLVQSVSSDINLLAGIDMQKWIIANGYENEMLIFALVHDSILAEVKDTHIELYLAKLSEFTQKDRAGMTIKGHPIGLDVEIGQSYGTVKEQ